MIHLILRLMNHSVPNLAIYKRIRICYVSGSIHSVFPFKVKGTFLVTYTVHSEIWSLHLRNSGQPQHSAGGPTPDLSQYLHQGY